MVIDATLRDRQARAALRYGYVELARALAGYQGPDALLAAAELDVINIGLKPDVAQTAVRAGFFAAMVAIAEAYLDAQRPF